MSYVYHCNCDLIEKRDESGLELICPSCDEKMIELDEVFERQLEDQLEDLLNECFPPISIGPYSYDPGRVLKEIDPIAFRQELLTYIDGQCKDGLLLEIDDHYYEVKP